MNRLTLPRNSDGTVSQPTNMDWYAVLDKLTAYEDTGMEPQEVPTGLEMAKMHSVIQELKKYRAAEDRINFVDKTNPLNYDAKDGEQYGTYVVLPEEPTGLVVAEAVTLMSSSVFPVLAYIENFKVIVKPYGEEGSWSIGIKALARRRENV